MGELLRRYWLPAVKSDEVVEPDGAPLRLRLLGEALIVFRDTEGRVGILDQFCRHRLDAGDAGDLCHRIPHQLDLRKGAALGNDRLAFQVGKHRDPAALADKHPAERGLALDDQLDVDFFLKLWVPL